MNTILTFTISGKSINELRKEYGTGSGAFYDQDWYANEPFANDRPKAGEYTINFGEDTRNKIFNEQSAGIASGFEVAHPTVIYEALLLHFKETGQWLCKDYWVRTSLLASDGYRVVVGSFDAGGLGISDVWDDYPNDSIGLSSARKSKTSLEPRSLDPLAFSSLELRVQALEDWKAKLTEALHGK